ncbi:hypothetical protein [Nonomuraea sp. NPDC023979]|uniref:hypothetical protein n=1 Tax=Nonomuraea sp. NPDC023979 TaxID=3154796 RepID=UPI0033D95B91
MATYHTDDQKIRAKPDEIVAVERIQAGALAKGIAWCGPDVVHHFALINACDPASNLICSCARTARWSTSEAPAQPGMAWLCLVCEGTALMHERVTSLPGPPRPGNTHRLPRLPGQQPPDQRQLQERRHQRLLRAAGRIPARRSRGGRR